ncbi:hypothetical protein CC1G_02945 [Coprinopsis cinerea okayama7|uniref:Uncharacterized protein n=1 Tax=Coprinopsis cinerea (strain Okayama-7 / 130 / ATCC MYA-4618 / FGSC 9003) TaxID=240176 RepID=A8NRU4_COPC7|nr:hypothetical protein CC1G_02945 [Coprinopsis cinerea okayama7\|eukprot:XP_001835857.2 hypothetical protein CC1G_02945 [Coprinopsis cinerea okayama7\
MPRNTHYSTDDRPSSSRRDDDRSYARRRSSRSRSPPPRRSDDRVRDRERDRGRSPSPGRDRHRRRRSYSRSRSHSPSRRNTARDTRSRSRDRRHRRKRARSSSASSASSEEDDTRSRRKKDKRREKRRSGSKERRKKEKKERKEKKKRSANSSQWGKYGIISDIDIFSKQAEFQTWLVEERKINPETITKDQEKKEFSRFVEDYNTATLPHEKYYNIEAYDKRMNALRQGEYLPPTDDFYDFEADLKAAKGAHKKKPVEQESYLSREELMELRKVQQERVELGKMKLLGMDIKSTYGVRMEKTEFDD